MGDLCENCCVRPLDEGVRTRAIKFSSLAVIGIALLSTLVPSVAASAATRPTVSPDVTCSGAGCNGASPTGSGCSSTAITAKTNAVLGINDLYLGEVQLRYSTACKTAWGKILSYYPIGAGTIVRSDGLNYVCNSLEFDSGTNVYVCSTRMVYDHPYTSVGAGLIVVNNISYAADTSPY
jgi:hypothetical protein